jgi:hypothetical protein
MADKNALYLPTGSIVAPPPVGQVALLAEADGSLKSMDSTGARSAIGGGLGTAPNNTMVGNFSGGAATPVNLSVAQILAGLGVTPFNDVRAAIMIRAQALCGSTVKVFNGTEFDKPNDFVSNASGSGIGIISTALGSGVVRVGTGTTAASNGKISLGGASALGAQITNLKTGPWYAYFRAAFATAIDAAATMELQLNASTGNALLAVGGRGPTSLTNWHIRTFDHAGNPWIATGALAAAIDLNFHDVEFWHDGTNINVAIDAAAQITPFVASGMTQGDPVYLQVTSANGATAANREWLLDRMCTVTPTN